MTGLSGVGFRESWTGPVAGDRFRLYFDVPGPAPLRSGVTCVVSLFIKRQLFALAWVIFLAGLFLSGTRDHRFLGELMASIGMAMAIVMMIASGLSSPNQILIGSRSDGCRWVLVVILSFVLICLLVGLVRDVLKI